MVSGWREDTRREADRPRPGVRASPGQASKGEKVPADEELRGGAPRRNRTANLQIRSSIPQETGSTQEARIACIDAAFRYAYLPLAAAGFRRFGSKVVATVVAARKRCPSSPCRRPAGRSSDARRQARPPAGPGTSYFFLDRRRCFVAAGANVGLGRRWRLMSPSEPSRTDCYRRGSRPPDNSLPPRDTREARLLFCGFDSRRNRLRGAGDRFAGGLSAGSSEGRARGLRDRGEGLHHCCSNTRCQAIFHFTAPVVVARRSGRSSGD